jgi:hypothetical protein
MLEQEAINEFNTQLRGELIQPGDPAYDEARDLGPESCTRKSGLNVNLKNT